MLKRLRILKEATIKATRLRILGTIKLTVKGVKTKLKILVKKDI